MTYNFNFSTYVRESPKSKESKIQQEPKNGIAILQIGNPKLIPLMQTQSAWPLLCLVLLNLSQVQCQQKVPIFTDQNATNNTCQKHNIAYQHQNFIGSEIPLISQTTCIDVSTMESKYRYPGQPLIKIISSSCLNFPGSSPFCSHIKGTQIIHKSACKQDTSY